MIWMVNGGRPIGGIVGAIAILVLVGLFAWWMVATIRDRKHRREHPPLPRDPALDEQEYERERLGWRSKINGQR